MEEYEEWLEKLKKTVERIPISRKEIERIRKISDEWREIGGREGCKILDSIVDRWNRAEPEGKDPDIRLVPVWGREARALAHFAYWIAGGGYEATISPDSDEELVFEVWERWKEKWDRKFSLLNLIFSKEG